MEPIQAAWLALCLTAPIWLWCQLVAVDQALHSAQLVREAELVQLWDRR